MSIYRELDSHFSLKHRESLVDCFPYRMLKSAVRVHGLWHMEREDGLVSLVSRDYSAGEVRFEGDRRRNPNFRVGSPLISFIPQWGRLDFSCSETANSA